jgi:hemerythrin superfamily protein
MPTRTSQHTASRSQSRSASAAREEIIAMLKKDHQKVKKAFRDFEQMDPQDDPDSCEALVRQTCAELQVHATLEEEVFYPGVREAMKEEDLIDEAEVEHMTAKMLIEQLQGMSAGDEKFAATFKVLGEYIRHHVKEEEGEIFEQLARARLDWEGLCDQMNGRRAELEQQMLPGGESPEAAGADEQRSGGKASARQAERPDEGAGEGEAAGEDDGGTGSPARRSHH